MAVRLSADTFEHSLGFLEDFAKSAIKAPQNSIPMIVGGVVGGLTYFNNKREGEDTLPSLSSALVAGGLAGLATNATMHHFDLPSRGPTPHSPNAAPQSTPPPTVPNPSTPPVPTLHNPIPATPAAQSSAAPVANKASAAPASTLNSSQARQEAVAATPIPDKPYEGVDIPARNSQAEVVGGKALVKHQEGGVTYVEEGTVPDHLKMSQAEYTRRFEESIEEQKAFADVAREGFDITPYKLPTPPVPLSEMDAHRAKTDAWIYRAENLKHYKQRERLAQEVSDSVNSRRGEAAPDEERRRLLHQVLTNKDFRSDGGEFSPLLGGHGSSALNLLKMSEEERLLLAGVGFNDQAAIDAHQKLVRQRSKDFKEISGAASAYHAPGAEGDKLAAEYRQRQVAHTEAVQQHQASWNKQAEAERMKLYELAKQEQQMAAKGQAIDTTRLGYTLDYARDPSKFLENAQMENQVYGNPVLAADKVRASQRLESFDRLRSIKSTYEKTMNERTPGTGIDASAAYQVDPRRILTLHNEDGDINSWTKLDQDLPKEFVEAFMADPRAPIGIVAHGSSPTASLGDHSMPVSALGQRMSGGELVEALQNKFSFLKAAREVRVGSCYVGFMDPTITEAGTAVMPAIENFDLTWVSNGRSAPPTPQQLADYNEYRVKQNQKPHSPMSQEKVTRLLAARKARLQEQYEGAKQEFLGFGGSSLQITDL